MTVSFHVCGFSEGVAVFPQDLEQAYFFSGKKIFEINKSCFVEKRVVNDSVQE